MDARGHYIPSAPWGSPWKIEIDSTPTPWEGLKIYFHPFITKTIIVHNILRIMYYIDKWGFVHTTNPNTGEE